MPYTTTLPDPLPAQAAIFDFDGTLADTARIWHEVDLIFLSRRHIPYTRAYAQDLAALGFVEGARYTIERYGLDETVEGICAEWTELSHELYCNEVRLRPGAEAYIRALRAAGMPVALATTNDPSVVEHMHHVAVDDLFDVRVYALDVGKGKDSPDIFLEASRRLGVAPDRCLVFEDIVPAVASAQGVSMLTCGVRANDPTQRVDELRRRADFWLDDWRDLAGRPAR